MSNRKAGLGRGAPTVRLGAGLRWLVDRAAVPATPACCAGEINAMDVAGERTRTTWKGVAARMTASCRLVCSVERLLSALMAIIAALVLVGLMGSQALAHDGHDAPAGVVADQIGSVASAEKIEPAGGLVIATADVAACDGHCCFSSLCCPAAALALDGSPVRPHPAAVAAASAVDLIAAGPLEGPRRPPKTRL